MIKRIAVLLACYNRKALTLNCLEYLHIAYAPYKATIQLAIYLTDDASTDGTKDAISANYPEVHILEGTGNLYWAGGMRNSWNEALKNDYDAYLLLNDDTNVSANLFKELLNCDAHAIQQFKSSGIYVGSTHDGAKNLTYGGAVITNKFFYKYKFLVPDGKMEMCDLGNANIMLVKREVVEKIGILADGYKQGIADYDYTLTARKKNIPVLIAADYCGICAQNSADLYGKFAGLSFSERRKYLYHPKGLALAEEVKFMKKFYPYRVPFIYAAALFKLLLPKAYIALNKLR